MGLFLKKNHLVRYWDCLYLPNWSSWGSYIFSITKTPCKKIGALIYSIGFFLLKLLVISINCTIWSCMKYFCHVCAGALNRYLDMLDNLQKWVYRTFGPTLATCLELLGHYRNLASLSLLKVLLWYMFISTGSTSLFLCTVQSLLYYFIWEPYNKVGSLRIPSILIDYMNFLLPSLDVLRMSMLTVFFVIQLDFGNSVPEECCPLTYELNSCKSRLKRHL